MLKFILLLGVFQSLIEADQLFIKQNESERHPCSRNCENSKNRICHYIFTVEKYLSMSVACFNCSAKTEDCYRHDCVSADGFRRSITTVNRMLPGPPIEVCLGDTIVVDVINEINSEATSIHWHGVHQHGTNFMDGVFGVTQTSIPPGGSFRYKFIPDVHGTYFWHGHIGIQRGNGIYGVLNVRKGSDTSSHEYDEDLSHHTILASDWDKIDLQAKQAFVTHSIQDDYLPVQNILINGRGRYWNDLNGTSNNIPISVFNVKKGKRYLFRFINAGSQDCPMVLSIDNHTLLVIASDLGNVFPTEVESILSFPGERYNFVVNANQTIGRYWIRIRGLSMCEINEVYQLAVLAYEGSSNEQPKGRLGYENSNRSGRILNPMNMEIMNKTAVSLAELDSVHYDEHYLNINGTLFLEANFNPVNNFVQHRNDYVMENLPEEDWHYVPQLNGITMGVSASALISSKSNHTFCRNETMGGRCKTNFCKCSHAIEVALNYSMEIVITNNGLYYVAHPFHLHGHDFRVLATESAPAGFNAQTFQEWDKEGKIKRKLKYPAMKDTFGVPGPGYSIIRVFFNNPGYWLFHCHMDTHLAEGMALVFKVGKNEEMKALPKGFPVYEDWLPDYDENL